MKRNVLVLAMVISLWPAIGNAQADSSAAPAFSPGWYIVQPTAEFSVLMLSGPEIAGDSTGGAAAFAQARIQPGEVVLAFEHSRGVYLVLESFGRMSAIRGQNPLVMAPSTGRPGMVVEDVQLLDGVLSVGSTLWINSIDAGAGTATVQLDGGRTQKIPNKSISVLMNAYSTALGTAVYKKVN